MTDRAFTQLLPDAAEVDGEQAILSLDLDGGAPPERPYVLVNFVASADGRAGFQGRSSPLADPGDRILFHALRERVDAVLAGTRTMALENYGRMLPKAERRNRRVRDGRTPEPYACLITRSGALPLDIRLFGEPEARVIVFAPAELDLDLSATSAHVARETLDPSLERPLTQALQRLRHEHGVMTLLCEGGPQLFGALLREGLVDELFLTLSPKLAGGDSAPPVTSGPPLENLAGLRLRWLLSLDDTLYLRYALIR